MITSDDDELLITKATKLKPALVTHCANQTLKRMHQEVSLFRFIMYLAMDSDLSRYKAQRILSAVNDQSKDLDDLLDQEYHVSDAEKPAAENPGPAVSFLRTRRQVFLQMFWCQCLDTFENYIVDLTRTILKSRPQLLKTHQQGYSLQFILEHQSLDELVQSIVERKVYALSQRGFRKLRDWCKDKGIPLSIPDDNEATLVEMIAARNLFVHNNGIVDQRYLAAVKDSRFKLGKRRIINPVDLFDVIGLTRITIIETDKAASEKFGLPLEPLAEQEETSKSEGSASTGSGCSAPE